MQFDATASAMQLKICTKRGHAASPPYLQPHIPARPLRWIYQSRGWKVNLFGKLICLLCSCTTD